MEAEQRHVQKKLFHCQKEVILTILSSKLRKNGA